jgi:hypothetical protein
VAGRGTAVGLLLRNPLSPLLDPGYVETTIRLHYEPLFDPAFDAMLADHYPAGVGFVINGRTVEKKGAASGTERAPLLVRLPRKRKPAASGFLERSATILPEDRQGIAVSTLGKVIRRGWDWTGLVSTSPGQISGLIEAPGLAAALTLNKGDFVRAGRRGITYLAYRKAIQEAVQLQLAAWGEARDREDSARRRAARPLERDLEAVLVDLAEEFPALAALVERRAGGQRRLPTGTRATMEEPERATGREPIGPGGPPEALAEATPGLSLGAPSGHEEAASSAGPTEGSDEAAGKVASEAVRPEPAAPESAPGTTTTPTTPATGTLPPIGPQRAGARRPTRYGLGIEFEERPDSPDHGRLVESTVLVNTAHPAYRRAVASRAEGYHAALTVGMALAAVAVEPAGTQEFLTTFLARWGEALGRDRRRRRGRPRQR